jgi:hypothetical protein
MFTISKKPKVSENLKQITAFHVIVPLGLITIFVGAQVYLFLEYIFNW